MAEISRLPATAVSLWEWQASGACLTADARLFFQPEGSRGPGRRNRTTAAQAVCVICPVILQCRRHALTVREP